MAGLRVGRVWGMLGMSGINDEAERARAELSEGAWVAYLRERGVLAGDEEGEWKIVDETVEEWEALKKWEEVVRTRIQQSDEGRKHETG